MPLNLSTYDELVKKIRADISKALPTLDPNIWISKIQAIADSNAGRHYDNQLSLQQLELEAFPNADSNIETLERWALYESLIIFVALPSAGNVIFPGTVSSVISEDEKLSSANDDSYTVNADATIANISITVTLVRSGNTVTATAATAISFATGLTVTMAGANQSEYNGDFEITMLTSLTFSYEITGTPATPATGTITASCDCAIVAIDSDESGIDQNLSSGAQLTTINVISGVERTETLVEVQ